MEKMLPCFICNKMGEWKGKERKGKERKGKERKGGEKKILGTFIVITDNTLQETFNLRV